MTKWTETCVPFASLALLMLAISVVVVHAAPTSYVPAVKAGDWAQYKLLYDSCTPPQDPACSSPGTSGMVGLDYALLHVIELTGPSGVTFQTTTAFTNGTISQMGISVDVSTGYSNVTGGIGSSSGTDYFVLAGGLSAPDPIWTVLHAPTLNSSLTKSVLGIDRSVNFLNITSSFGGGGYSFSLSYGYAFDAQTGVFIEFSFETQSSSPSGSFDERFAVGMVDNNLWLPHNLPSDFSLGSDPASIMVQQGGIATATVNLKAFNGFKGSVNLAVAANLPSGITTSFNPATIDSSTTAVMIVTADSTAAQGSYSIRLTGTAGSLTRPLSIPLTVAAPPDFSISAGAVSPLEILAGSPYAGSYGQSMITIIGSNGFNGLVAFQASASTGLNCRQIDPRPQPGLATLSCSSMVAGDYTATVTGTAIIGTTPVSHTTANIVFHITDFAVSASSVSPSTLPAGSSGSAMITLTPSNHFTGMVTLSPTGLPSGITTSFDHATIDSSATAVMTISVAGSVSSGTYNFQVIGTDGTLSHHVDISIDVSSAPDFALASSSSSLTLDSGETGHVDITLAPQGGFSDRAALSYSISPSTGLTCNFDNNYVQGSSSARLTCSGTTPGSYTITLTGTAGNKHRSTPVTVTVKSAAPVPIQPAKILGLDPPAFYGTLAGIIAIAVVGGLAVLLRARKRQTT